MMMMMTAIFEVCKLHKTRPFPTFNRHFNMPVPTCAAHYTIQVKCWCVASVCRRDFHNCHQEADSISFHQSMGSTPFGVQCTLHNMSSQ